MKRLFYHILFLLPFLACQDELGRENNTMQESINGFAVTWRPETSQDEISVARKILSDMVEVKGGVFVMGATPEQADFARINEYPNLYVSLSDYYICRFELTQEQANTLLGNNLTHLNSIGWLSIYDWELIIDILSDITSIKFDLPTEAQWEYAARGGQLSKNYIYPGSNDINEVRSTSPTEGSNVPNELGLYNMADLRSEWCRDFYTEYNGSGLISDRFIDKGKYYVVRGGDYMCTLETEKYKPEKESRYNFRYGAESASSEEKDFRNCRTTSRSYHSLSDIGNKDIGCRLVINLTK